jgi:RsiW-degrading membrane proteinase PrsW (M82 family)
MAFAVFMGIFYGRAKWCANRGNAAGAKFNMIMGFVSAVFLHGFYDSCCMIGTGLATVIFLGFVVFMYFVVMRVVKKASWEDRPL